MVFARKPVIARWCGCIGMICILPVPAGGQSVIARQSAGTREASNLQPLKTVADYVAYALDHNPAVSAAIDNVTVRQREAELAGSIPDPMLMAKAGIGERVSLSGIGLSQMIMWPGKLAAMKTAGNHSAEAQLQQLAAVMAAVEAEVRISFASLYATGQTISRQKENLELLKQVEETARARYIGSGQSGSILPSSAGGMAASGSVSSGGQTGAMAMGGTPSSITAPPSAMGSGGVNAMPGGGTDQSSLLKIQIEQVMLDDKIKNAETRAASERAGLRALLGDGSLGIPFPQNIDPLNVPLSDSAVIAAVKEKSPQVIAMEHEAASAAAMVSAAKRGFFPDLLVGAEYMPSAAGSSMNSSNSGNMIDGTFNPSLSLSVPVWIGKKKREIDRARRMESAMNHQLADMKNSIIAQAQGLLNELHDAQRRIDLYGDVLVPQSKQVVSVVQAAYYSGQSSYLDVIDGQRTLIDLQVSLANEYARREIAAAGILRILGSGAFETVAASSALPQPPQPSPEKQQ